MHDNVIYITASFFLVESCCFFATVPETFHTVTKQQTTREMAYLSRRLKRCYAELYVVCFACAEFSSRTGPDVIRAGQLLFRRLTRHATAFLCPCQTR